MDVHVHQVERHLQEETRVAPIVAGSRRAIGLGHGLRHRSIAHRPAVHEQPQVRPRGARTVRPRDEPVHADSLALVVHCGQVVHERAAEELEQPGRQAVRRRRLDDLPPAGRQREAHLRPGQRQQRHGLGHVPRLGRVRPEELAPGRHLAEEVAHLDGGAPRGARHRARAPGGRASPRPRCRRAPSRRGCFRERCATLAIEGRASPRNPCVPIDSRSESARSLEVAWRSSAASASSRDMPWPSSRTRISVRPPPSISTCTPRAPASSAFSTSSFTTDAGRSTTSPAAILLTRSSGSRWTRRPRSTASS